MELEILDTYEIETYGSLEEHQQKIKEMVDKLEPEYYTVSTDIKNTVWISTITVMESK